MTTLHHQFFPARSVSKEVLVALAAEEAVSAGKAASEVSELRLTEPGCAHVAGCCHQLCSKVRL